MRWDDVAVKTISVFVLEISLVIFRWICKFKFILRDRRRTMLAKKRKKQLKEESRPVSGKGELCRGGCADPSKNSKIALSCHFLPAIGEHQVPSMLVEWTNWEFGKWYVTRDLEFFVIWIFVIPIFRILPSASLCFHNSSTSSPRWKVS